MSWKSLMTTLPEQTYKEQRHTPTAESRVNPVSKEWVTPAHPSVTSRQRHMVGLGRDSTSKGYSPKYGNEGRTPPVAQVHPNMPSRPRIQTNDHVSKPPVATEVLKMQRDTTIEGCEATEPPHRDWKTDMKGPDGDSFSALHLEETMDLPAPTNEQYVYPTHRKDFDSYALSSKLQRAQIYDYDVPGQSHQIQSDDNYSAHGRRAVPVQAQLTYNSGQGILSSPQKYRASSSGSLRSPGRYSSSSGNTAAYSVGYKGQDLGHWQQLHQQQLRQHYDQLQHMQTGLAQGSTNGSSHYQHSVSTVLTQDPNKWDALIRAKESILQEKNMIIEKQKFQIGQLQEQVREQEAKERHRLMTRFEDGDVLALKMQEYQYENAALKAQIAELASNKNIDIDHFNRKLGQTEYELEETKAALRELALEKKKGLEDIRQQLNDKEEKIMDLSSENKKLHDKLEKVKNRKDSLERYLEDLPTAEEHHKKSDELKHLKDKDSILSEKISQLEKLLSAAKKTIRSKDIKMSALESKHSDLKIEVESLQDKLDKAAQKKQRAEGDANTSIDDDVDELKFQRDQLNAECERLKKLLESKHNKQKSMQAQHQGQIQQIEERLQQEEDTVTALREALSSKEDSMKRMQTSMKELATQSQEMYEHNLNLQEKVEEYEQSLNSETMKVYNKLMKEMTACVVDLKGITQICTQRAEGKDPNISMLLGLRSSSVANEYEEDVDPTSIETMKHKLVQIREMRQEIEKLRTLISDKYAEDIGDNCITQ